MAVQARLSSLLDMTRAKFLHVIPLPFALGALLLPAPMALVPAPAQAFARETVASWDEAGWRLLGDLQSAGEQVATIALARWISTSREDALAAGVLPIPAEVRARLQGHVPEVVLEKARYRVGTGHEFSLHTNAFQRGNAAAITLDDVVLFRSEADANANVTLWAHELHHVQQYDRWGVQGFAQRYTRDYRTVEAEAEDEAARIAAAIGSAR